MINNPVNQTLLHAAGVQPVTALNMPFVKVVDMTFPVATSATNLGIHDRACNDGIILRCTLFAQR